MDAIIGFSLLGLCASGFIFLCVFTIWQYKKLSRFEGYLDSYYMNVKKLLMHVNDLLMHVNDRLMHVGDRINHSYSQLLQLHAICEQHNENIQSRIIKLHTTVQSNYDDLKVRLESQTSTITKCVDTDKKDVISSLTDTMKSLHNPLMEMSSKHIETLKKETTILQSTLNKLNKQEQEHYSSISHGMNDMTAIWKKHLETLQPFEELLQKTEDLYQSILQEEESLSQQEKSVLSAVEKQTQIAQLTYELNQTSKDIYELMRLYLMNSIVEYTNNMV